MDQKIYERLRFLEKKIWKNKKEMAEDLEISYSFLANILRGERRIPAWMLEKLAKREIDMNWLLAGRENSKYHN